jgi:hypothetical protein
MTIYTTDAERESFMQRLDAGEMSVPPGYWFRFAAEASENPLASWHKITDCAKIAAVEIEGITETKVDPDVLLELPLFLVVYGGLDADKLDGLRQVLIRLARYEKWAMSNAASAQIEEASPAAIRKWAVAVAGWIVRAIPKPKLVMPTDLMIDRGLAMAKERGCMLEPAGAARVLNVREQRDTIGLIWRIMQAAQGEE